MLFTMAFLGCEVLRGDCFLLNNDRFACLHICPRGWRLGLWVLGCSSLNFHPLDRLDGLCAGIKFYFLAAQILTFLLRGKFNRLGSGPELGLAGHSGILCPKLEVCYSFFMGKIWLLKWIARNRSVSFFC